MKLLIIDNTIINFGDDKGGVDVAIGDTVDVTKDTGATLVRAGRALYVDRKDDPSKDKRDTATDAMLKAAAEMSRKPKS